MKINSTETQQQSAVLHVADTFKQYKDLLSPYYSRLLAVYKELNTFTYPKKSERSTTFKVNKMYEVSNKITPRIVWRNPKWIVSIKPDMITKLTNQQWTWEEQQPLDIWTLEMQAKAVQDLLTTTFDKYNLTEPVRLWAKGMVNYWPWFAKVVTKYDINRKIEPTDKEETITKPDWTEEVIKVTKQIKETVANEYVTIEPVSWTDMYYDPRYIMFKDMPAVIHVVSWVRLADIKRNDDYINTDKLSDIAKLDNTQSNYKSMVQAISWLTTIDIAKVDKNNLQIKFYYGLYDIKDDWDERLYKIWVANDLICICLEEITQIPFEQIRCFEDTESNLSVGFLESIMWLQQELNYKKNSASEYINHALNRSWIRSANSWINPKKLISKPNNIIPTSKSVDEAMKNLQEVPHRELNTSYFQEQNDFERQIQWLTFTIDTNNSQNQQWLTNTATGMRIKFFESNSVIEEIRKHLEQWLERLAYKLLSEIAENTDENLTIKQMDDTWFREINKEAIVDAIEKYEIKIEAWSSSYDSIENRRDDAIAKGNIWLQYAWAWVAVDLEEIFKDTLNTFEWVDATKYIKKQPIQMPWVWNPIWWWQIPLQQPAISWPEALTQWIAWWSIQAGML